MLARPRNLLPFLIQLDIMIALQAAASRLMLLLHLHQIKSSLASNALLQE